MLQVFKLLLPALIPSWRFFDVVGPSPRIEYQLLQSQNNKPDNTGDWQDLYPLPPRIPIRKTLGNLFYNPKRNAALYSMSCAEWLVEQHTKPVEVTLQKNIESTLRAKGVQAPYVQFRIAFISKLPRGTGHQLQKDITFVSAVQPLVDKANGTNS